MNHSGFLDRDEIAARDAELRRNCRPALHPAPAFAECPQLDQALSVEEG